MNRGDRITEMYAFICLDEKDDAEGIPAIEGPFVDGKNTFMPLVAADRERVDALMPMVREMAKETKRNIRLVKFSTMETIEQLPID
jgi:hypothetical protein